MKSIQPLFSSLSGQKNYEVHVRGNSVTLPEGSGGEECPGPLTVAVGETNHSKWPDAFEGIGLFAFRKDLVDAFKQAGILGVEWYPIVIAEVRNRRLLRLPPPDYFWPRFTGRIRTTPYYSIYVDTPNADGTSTSAKERTEDPVELDQFGCLVKNKRKDRYIGHEIIPSSWDGSDLMLVLPRVAPYELCSEKFANLLTELNVENVKAFPLRKGYGL